ncbi:MAG: hypothetical protein RIT04_605 [Candidatus Parcubacteria bacterium]|jgi:hypothetical protein
MFHLVLGITLLFAPFLAVFFYRNIGEGLFKIGLYTAAFHLVVSIITQGFHVFNYPVVIFLHTVFSVLLLYISYISREVPTISETGKSVLVLLKNNSLFFLALIVMLAQLCFVHYSYTGTVQTIRGQIQISNSNYPYPLVSDEWVTASLARYAITQNALPLVNPLNHNQYFPNILFTFSSVVAELFLITGLNPFIHYSLLSIVFAIILCLSVYALLRKYEVSSGVSTAVVLFVPYIANSGNLPALWAFLPVTAGVILFFWQLISQKSGSYVHASFYMFLGIIAYPPIFVFSFVALLIGLMSFYRNTQYHFWKCVLLSVSLSIGAAVTLYYFVLAPSGIKVWHIFSTYIIRPNPDGGIVSYAVRDVLPWLIIPLAIVGVCLGVKRRWYEIIAVACVGSLYWVTYAFINSVFIIENPRVVFITSLFFIVLAGIGLEYFCKKFGQHFAHHRVLYQHIYIGIGFVAIIGSLLLLPGYTSRNMSNSLVLNMVDEVGNKQRIVPTVAVNRYLVADDMRLFGGLHGQTFIAPPWKGLVLTAITDNVALETKAATITNNFLSYAQFMSLDCPNKVATAERYQIGYVYSDEFLCQNFIEIGLSSEGLHLYRFQAL